MITYHNMISLRCPLNFLGYGRASYGIFKSLVLDHNQNICYFPIGNPEAEPQFHSIIQKSVENQQLFDPNNNSLTIWHQNQLETRIGKKLNAALSFFELDILSNQEQNHISNMDIFIQASQWGANIVKRYLPKQKVITIPMGVDSDYFQPISINIDKPYRFISVGKWEIRKGHDILHELFNQAFTQDDNVELYCLHDNPFLPSSEQSKWENTYKSTSLGNKIYFIPRKLDLRPEFAAADCGIFPSRAESIGLPILELMSMNKPIITTGYSGITEFCNKNNSFLVEIDNLESAIDGLWFHGDGNWAEIGQKQRTQFIEYMRFCYKNRLSRNEAGRITAQTLDWKNVSQKILVALNE